MIRGKRVTDRNGADGVWETGREDSSGLTFPWNAFQNNYGRKRGTYEGSGMAFHTL